MILLEVRALTYEELLVEAENNNLIVKEKPLPISKGRIKGNRVAIRKGMTELEKACVLAEELGHHYTAVGDIITKSKSLSSAICKASFLEIIPN